MKYFIKKGSSLLLAVCLLFTLFGAGAMAVTRGDVDQDGVISSADARLALRRSVKLEDYLPGSARFIAADMDGDGAVQSNDARAVLRTSVKLPSEIETIEPEEKAPDEAFQSAMLRFALALFRQTAAQDKGQNLLVSPLSVMTALNMAANGTAGETLAQLETALGGLTTADLNAYLHTLMNNLPNSEQSRLHVANSVWVNNIVRQQVKQPFLQNMLAYYGAGINACDFDLAALEAINNWVKENTEDMIDSILDEPDPDILMLLLNALAFDAKWQRQFDEYRVKKTSFTQADGQKKDCDMMYGEENVYLEDENTVGFLKAYAGGGYRFVALLPDEGVDIDDYIASLTPEKLSALFAGAQKGISVNAGLPKFTFDYSVTMNDALQAMGIKDLFSASACNFSNMFTPDVGAYVSKVLHKTFIEVNTEGTRAAAVTAVVIEKNAILDFDSKTVILDRPFVFLITMGEADTPVFIGVLNQTTP